MTTALLALWITWCVGNLITMYLGAPKHVPACTGFRIVMPRSLHEVLTVEEYCAVFAHERGHQILHHIWKNYARACLFIFISEKARLAQELEADDYAASAGHAKTLASAIRKLSGAQIDRNRAARLELLST